MNDSTNGTGHEAAGGTGDGAATGLTGRTPATAAAAAPEAAARVWAAMSFLVLKQENRRSEVEEALGMSFFRVKALRRLLTGPLTMRELTASLSTDKPYTTLVVDELERRGFVERNVHPDDRRSKIVTLTAAGTAAAEQAEHILSRPPHTLLALGPEDLAALDRVMAKLRSPAPQGPPGR
ncbi:MarR family winged helix-turn-helix transcriptional regulator [Saccharothrix sp. ST-888]|uniref:MarR family winged helix-turn-helix transcriptional regulator n=1 Tax=Saccharothrix sp. ST-888 TaxID=1427391 RepID=UPI0009E342C4|nr:MarR family transcriptional regulator [Saccharothrix sp. ST-888]